MARTRRQAPPAPEQAPSYTEDDINTLIDESRNLLASGAVTDEGEKAELEEKIRSGEKALDDLRQEQQQQFKSKEEELQFYRDRYNRERFKANVDQVTAVVAQGVKADLDRQRTLYQEVVQQSVQESLAKIGINPGQTMQDQINTALGNVRYGAKAPVEYSDHPQTVYMDGRAPAHIQSARMGEKPTFGKLLIAVGQKALGMVTAQEVAQIQTAMGVKAVGYKALAEGGGADSSVAGPGGGYMVPPEYYTELIGFLYARVVLRGAGIQVIPMRSNILKQPRMTSTARATYVGETQAIPVTLQGFGQSALQAHKVTAMTPISRELVEDSDPSIETTVKDDLGEQLSLAEDLAFLLGISSPNAPQGILTATGTTQYGAVGVNGDPMSYEMIVNLRTALNRKSVPSINRFWVCSPDITGEIAKVKSPGNNYVFVDNGFSVPNSMVMQNQPQNRKLPVGNLLGWPVFESSQIPNGTTGTATTGLLALVEGSEVRIGQRGEILLDASKEGTYVDAFGVVQSAYQNDEVIYRAILRHDVMLRHPEAVAVRSGIVISTQS